MLEYSPSAVYNFVFCELKEWKRLIDCDKLGRANVLRPKLEKRAKEFGPTLPRLCYEMYAARLYRAANDIEAFDKTMAYLETVESEIAEWGMLRYLYIRLKGMRALSKRQFKESLDLLLEAEKMIGVEDNVEGDAAFYYAIGYCLTDLHNPDMAIDYLKKAQLHAFQKGHQKHDLDIQRLLAENHSKIGEYEKAYDILNECLISEKRKKKTKPSSPTLGCVHLSYGIVCYKAKKYSEALKHFDAAMQNLEESSEQYVISLYYNALALIDSDKPEMSLPYLDKGISLSYNMTMWETLFNALKHLQTLSNPESRHYMINTAIPKVQEYGHCERAAAFCKKLCEYYKMCGQLDKALVYCNLALEITEKLMK